MMRVFKFYPGNKSKFHFGDNKGKLKNCFSSDQLFSAIFNNLITLYGTKKVETEIKDKLKETVFSSLNYGMVFTNITDNSCHEISFLPRPLASIRKQGEKENLQMDKRNKKIEFFSLDAFKLLNKSWRKEEEFFDFDLSQLKIIGDKFACTSAEINFLNLTTQDMKDIKLFTQEAKPKVVVPRLCDSSEQSLGHFYYQEESEVNFIQIGNYLISPFMYFICQGEINSAIRAAIMLIADEGLGGKRSQGMGFFEKVQETEVDEKIFAVKETSHYLSLSSVFPQEEEVENVVYYKLVERSGYIYSQQGRALRKKRVRLFEEGSIFKAKTRGKVIDVSPDWFKEHEVYLDGRAFLIPLGEVGR